MVAKQKLSRCKAGPGEPGSSRKTAAERVFETARSLFYTRGVRAVGVDEIVAQAGVTKPSLYRAYASKDELVTACLEECMRETKGNLEELLEGMPDDPRLRLEAIMGYFAVKLQQPDYRGCPLSNTAVEFPEPGHPARAVAEDGKAQMRDRILGLTRQLGIREPEVLADGLLLVVEGAMASHHLFGSQGPASALLATAKALIATHVDGRVHA